LGQIAFSTLGCNQSPSQAPPTPSSLATASPPARELTKEQAAQVLAKVGDVTITLGDYAAALERMDRYERLRYQSADRRQLLLDEMINLELFAQEARRQKLDQDPEFQLRLDEALRDEVLVDLRSRIPSPEAIEAREVRAYYESHRKEFREPERRRVSAIVVSSEAKALAILDQAKTSSPINWGELVRKHSILQSESSNTPLELEGDLGIVSAPGEPQGTGPKLKEAVLRAVFEIRNVGDVYGKPVQDDNRFYIIRLTGRTEARERSFSEAERSIRVRLVDERIEREEQALILRLKQSTPIVIDEKSLEKLRISSKPKKENLKDALAH
jgi:parvulin-like peptidyl-prolyl isomerase